MIKSDRVLKPVQCYVSPAGNNKIADWYEGLSAQERSDADTFLDLMRRSLEWKPPHYKPRLSGYRQLGELRWSSEKKEHRLIGYLEAGAFFAMMGCTHKGSVYDPKDALEEADKRKSRVRKGEAITVPYDL